MTLDDFLLARIEDMEKPARELLRDLEGQIAEEYTGAVDEKGPMTPARLLAAQMWSTHDGQTRRRSFAKGQQIAALASPESHLAFCQAQRAIVESYRSTEAAKEGMNAVNEPGQKLVCAGMETGLRIAVQLLASLHHEHPDYRPEWSKV